MAKSIPEYVWAKEDVSLPAMDWDCFYGKLRTRSTSGLAHEPGADGTVFHSPSFTELAPVINSKCFSPVTQQVDGEYRTGHKSSMANPKST